jgi:hypothetical protein
MKKVPAVVSAVLILLIAGVVAPFISKEMMADGTSHKLKEPMLIAGEPIP